MLTTSLSFKDIVSLKLFALLAKSCASWSFPFNKAISVS